MPASTMDFYNIAFPHRGDQAATAPSASAVGPVDFSDMPLYDLSLDPGNDSAPSPISPTFPPSLANPYQLPQQPDWLAWQAKAAAAAAAGGMSPDFPSNESFMTASPVVNPLDLSKRGSAADSIFGGQQQDVSPFDELHSSTPLFDTGAADSVAVAVPPASKSRKTSAVTAARQPSTTTRGSYSSYEPLSPSTSSEQQPRYPSRKRKSLASTVDSIASSPRSSISPGSPIPTTTAPTAGAPSSISSASSSRRTSAQPKKTAHNMIEKRYRNNLNDKIAALRDAVPALRIAAQRLENGGTGASAEDAGAAADEADDEFAEELGGIAPAQKLNKATILSKAAEYIAFLERKNKALAEENEKLRKGIEDGGEGATTTW